MKNNFAELFCWRKSSVFSLPQNRKNQDFLNEMRVRDWLILDVQDSLSISLRRQKNTKKVQFTETTMFVLPLKLVSMFFNDDEIY